jgi:hypothetical protein
MPTWAPDEETPGFDLRELLALVVVGGAHGWRFQP